MNLKGIFVDSRTRVVAICAAAALAAGCTTTTTATAEKPVADPPEARTPRFAPSPSRSYELRAGGRIYYARSVRIEGDWVVIEGLTPTEKRERTYWIPRESVQFIAKSPSE
jgi:hypothetical protein